jgi:hypothetical protein
MLAFYIQPWPSRDHPKYQQWENQLLSKMDALQNAFNPYVYYWAPWLELVQDKTEEDRFWKCVELAISVSSYVFIDLNGVKIGKNMTRIKQLASKHWKKVIVAHGKVHR